MQLPFNGTNFINARLTKNIFSIWPVAQPVVGGMEMQSVANLATLETFLGTFSLKKTPKPYLVSENRWYCHARSCFLSRRTHLSLSICLLSFCSARSLSPDLLSFCSVRGHTHLSLSLHLPSFCSAHTHTSISLSVSLSLSLSLSLHLRSFCSAHRA